MKLIGALLALPLLAPAGAAAPKFPAKDARAVASAPQTEPAPPARPFQARATSGAEPAAPQVGLLARALELPADYGPLRAIYRPPMYGRGSAILLISAFGQKIEGLDPLAMALQKRGYAVLGVEYPGMILKKKEGGPIKLDPWRYGQQAVPGLMKDLSAAIRFLEDEPTASMSTLAVVGNGLGANLAAILGASDPRVTALAYIHPGKFCDPSSIQESLSASSRKPSLLVTGIKDVVFKDFFRKAPAPEHMVIGSDTSQAAPGDQARPEAAGTEAAAAAAQEEPADMLAIPHLEDVLSWLVAHYPSTKS